MQPNHYDILSHGPEGAPDTRPPLQMTREGYQTARDSRMVSRNQSGAAPMRSEDSWIEVSSQPSSSSLSSAATTDEIVTTGLRVERQNPGSGHHSRRKHIRRFAATSTHISYSSREPSIASSSQDEYEESESESDRVLSSSNEDITTRSRGDALLLRNGSVSEASSSDDGDHSTALGLRISSSPFVPQPNVFSHPPASQPHHSRARTYNGARPSPSLVSNCSRSTAVRHNSTSTVRNARWQQPQPQQHSPYNMISPSHQADHDAALRASLSTLLSCAAAARGLPKNDSPPVPAGPSIAPVSGFRLVSESVAMGEGSGEELSTQPNNAGPSSPPRFPGQHKPARSEESPDVSKPKRRAAPSKERGSNHPSATKKSRRTNLTDSMSAVSPTIVTWVISAGVVVLFSAISFSAGYALGREVGRTEANGGMGSIIGGSGSEPFTSARASVGCGREAVKGGLRGLRWGAVGSGSSVYN